MPPRISVIIPAFNAEMFIADAINSVLAQRYSSETEIIVIDDGSSDNTKAVVSDMATHYHQITLLLNDRKKGPSGARNSGLLKATGDYVAFLDADDLWCPNHLEKGVDFLERHNNIDVVFYNFEIHEYETKMQICDWFSERSFSQTLNIDKLDDEYYFICDDMFAALLDESFMHLQSMIIRSRATRGVLFNEDINRSEDRDFSVRLYLDSQARFAFKNIVTGIYYRHCNSLTSNSVQNELSTMLDHITLFTGYLSRELLDTITASKLKRSLFDRHMSASYYYRKLNRHRHAVTYLFKSLRYGIAASQLREFAKIAVSFVIFGVRQRKLIRLPAVKG